MIKSHNYYSSHFVYTYIQPHNLASKDLPPALTDFLRFPYFRQATVLVQMFHKKKLSVINSTAFKSTLYLYNKSKLA